ncbi:MAG: GNAT family N-acetyltransferase [Bacteroidota bacterium]|nr:GNAT family N-acetyltransferase [Bacteroidota bacterium]
MKLLPIELDETQNNQFAHNPECLDILKVYPEFYQRVGFHKPWIGYFVANDDNFIIGCGGYKGQPKDGKIEIAYGTFEEYQNQGVGTEICRQLVQLSLQTDPSVKITARTLPDNLASIGILKKNGFECNGLVFDEEDGEVLEWELKKPGTR